MRGDSKSISVAYLSGWHLCGIHEQGNEVADDFSIASRDRKNCTGKREISFIDCCM
ncbi:MAG TPA: hypothetical protein PLG43_02915 [Spirochaetia bacterium]|nr:hypothetical protein [Spirochaetia bacterium]